MFCLKCRLEINPYSNNHHGLHLDCFQDWFQTSTQSEFSSLQRKSNTDSLNSNNLSQNNSFFHGKFKKYSAILNNQSYILKMRQDEAPELPEVEYLCNQIGKLLGIPVAEFYFIDFNNDKIFVTKNFIKPGVPIDLQHIYHFRDDGKHDCKELIKVISETTQSPRDVKIFIKTLLFDSLIGNHDRHGRNLGFIVKAKKISLSPIYDNVSYLSLESGNMLKADFNPTGKISTCNNQEPSMKDYVIELKNLGYRDDAIEFYNNINLDKLYNIIDFSFCSELMKTAIRSLITKRYKEIKDEL